MKLFAIGDLHLNGKADKPMDVFGSNWDRHREKIFDAWQSLVSPSDCVLVPGDICWAMYLEDAVDDLNSIAELNGTKILIRGNHDYWWASPTRIRAVLPAGMYIVQNDSVDMCAFSVCGSRGWMLPSAANFGKADEKIFNRELIRLEMSLKAACHNDAALSTCCRKRHADGFYGAYFAVSRAAGCVWASSCAVMQTRL